MGTVALVSESNHLKRLSTIPLLKKRKENPKCVFYFMAAFVKMLTEQTQSGRNREEKDRAVVERGIIKQAAPTSHQMYFQNCYWFMPLLNMVSISVLMESIINSYIKQWVYHVFSFWWWHSYITSKNPFICLWAACHVCWNIAENVAEQHTG